MKLLLINYEYPPVGAGAANATRYLGKCFVKQGHETYVLTSSFRNLRGWSTQQGVRIFRCPAKRRNLFQSNMVEMFSYVLSAFFVMPWLLKKKKIDFILVFFSFPCGPLGLWGKLLFKIPYGISLRGGDVPGNEPSLDFIHKVLRPLRHLVLGESILLTANSEGLKRISEKTDPFPVEVISNGVDSDFFKPPGNKNTHDQVNLLFVGRFQYQKNLFFLLTQLDELAREVTDNFKLHLIGEGPLEKELKRFAVGLQIRNKIYWHGWCGKDQLKQRYQNADCIINPSLYEGMPNVLLEAMACGLPVIASNVAGNNEVVKNGETGFIFDLKQPHEFKDAVVRIIQNKDLSQSMGKNARLWVERELTWENLSKEYIRLIEKNWSNKHSTSQVL